MSSSKLLSAIAGGEGYHPEESGESMDGEQPGGQGPRNNKFGHNLAMRTGSPETTSVWGCIFSSVDSR